MKSRWGFTVLGLLVFACCVATQTSNEQLIEYQTTATQFCNSANYTEHKCGFSDEGGVGEDAGVKVPTFLFTGTIFSGWSNGTAWVYPPVTHEGNENYFQYLPRVISLACYGPVEVSLIFKRTDAGRGNGCVKLGFDGGSNITRCELTLPKNYENEDDAAKTATVGNCVKCSTCTGEIACPLTTGTWYRDTRDFQISKKKCPPSEEPLYSVIYFDPGVVVRLAAFDIHSVK
jgi:hypothetical protein